MGLFSWLKFRKKETATPGTNGQGPAQAETPPAPFAPAELEARPAAPGPKRAKRSAPAKKAPATKRKK